MRVDDGRVVPNFCRQALQGKPITVYGAGNQTRSFCYVSDLIKGIIKVMDSKKANGEVLNIGKTEEIKIMELAEKIKELTDSNSKIVHKSLPPGNPSRRKPDISKIKNMTD